MHLLTKIIVPPTEKCLTLDLYSIVPRRIDIPVDPRNQERYTIKIYTFHLIIYQILFFELNI